MLWCFFIFLRGWGGGGRRATESCIDNRSCICIQIGFISPYYWARSERIGSKFSAVGSTEWHSECRIFNRLILKDKFKTGAHWTKKLNSPELFFSNCLKTVRRTDLILKKEIKTDSICIRDESPMWEKVTKPLLIGRNINMINYHKLIINQEINYNLSNKLSFSPNSVSLFATACFNFDLSRNETFR